MAFPERPSVTPATLDVREYDRLQLQRVKVGTFITGMNGSDSVWKVVQPGHFKLVEKAPQLNGTALQIESDNSQNNGPG